MASTSYGNRGFASISPLLIALFIFTAGPANAQSAVVKVTAQVSAAITVSVADAQVEGSGVRVISGNVDQRTVRVSLEGSSSAPTEIRIPVYLRSNVGYELSASMKTSSATLCNLLVTSARATGQFVAPGALENLHVVESHDGRIRGSAAFAGEGFAIPDLSSPVMLLRGSRISRAGTLTSPRNALEVMLAVAINPPAGADRWTVELVLAA